MERNNVGQVIIKESGSLLLSIPCITSTISVNTYNRFLLDEREFTELTPTIDKDALIRELTGQVNSLNSTVNNLTTDLKGGFSVSVNKAQYAIFTNPKTFQSNAITYDGQKVWENIGFDDDTTSPNFNSRQSNGQKFWSIANKAATVYRDANSLGNYNLNATIKYRFKYIGPGRIDNIQSVNTTLRFYQVIVENNVSQPIGSTGEIINRNTNLVKTSYNTGDVTQEFSATLVRNDYLLGQNTDVVYFPVQYYFSQLINTNSTSTRSITNDFIMEILPGSTFSMLPQ